LSNTEGKEERLTRGQKDRKKEEKEGGDTGGACQSKCGGRSTILLIKKTVIKNTDRRERREIKPCNKMHKEYEDSPHVKFDRTYNISRGE